MGDMATMPQSCIAKDAEEPRELAEAIAERLRADDKVAKVDVAGPGFINLALKPHVWVEELQLHAGDRQGLSAAPSAKAKRSIIVDLLRPACDGADACRARARRSVGDANLLALFTGYDVTREYYMNDAGAQVDVLARSAFLRYREALGEDLVRFPVFAVVLFEEGDVGGALAADHGPKLSTMKEAEWLPIVRAKAISMMNS